MPGEDTNCRKANTRASPLRGDGGMEGSKPRVQGGARGARAGASRQDSRAAIKFCRYPLCPDGLELAVLDGRFEVSDQKVRAQCGAAVGRIEDRTTLENDPSAGPDAGMAGQRDQSPPPAPPHPRKRTPPFWQSGAKPGVWGKTPERA
jgi:hypothetical protein